MKNYFRLPYTQANDGYRFELRAVIALELLEKGGILMGTVQHEDSQGRAFIEVMPAPEVVDRAFAMAEHFVSVAEEKGYLKECPVTIEEAMATKGRLGKIEQEAHWRRTPEELAEEQKELQEELQEVKAKRDKLRDEMKSA